MQINRWISAAWIVVASACALGASAGELERLPMSGQPKEKGPARFAVSIQNPCGKWVLVRVSPFARQESNAGTFKIRVPAGTDVLTGSLKGEEDNLIFTIKPEHAGQILNVCG